MSKFACLKEIFVSNGALFGQTFVAYSLYIAWKTHGSCILPARQHNCSGWHRTDIQPTLLNIVWMSVWCQPEEFCSLGLFCTLSSRLQTASYVECAFAVKYQWSCYMWNLSEAVTCEWSCYLWNLSEAVTCEWSCYLGTLSEAVNVTAAVDPIFFVTSHRKLST